MPYNDYPDSLYQEHTAKDNNTQHDSHTNINGENAKQHAISNHDVMVALRQVHDDIHNINRNIRYDMQQQQQILYDLQQYQQKNITIKNIILFTLALAIGLALAAFIISVIKT